MIDTNELRSQANVLVSWEFPSKSYSAELLNEAADTIDRQAALIAKYEAVLKEYADREKWGRNCESSWIQTVRGWELAEYALKGNSDQ